LAPREAAAVPWNSISVNLIGPWTLQVGQNTETFHALTIIDNVTNLVELVRIDNKSLQHVANKLEQSWLHRYPIPTSCIYDQGKEFVGWPFTQRLQQYGITGRPTTVKNPQANAICERMHQTVGNTLRVISRLHPPNALPQAQAAVDEALSNCVLALRTSFSSAINAAPGSVTFSREMIFAVPLVADWLLIQQRRQQLIDQRLISANNKRYSYDYQPGQEVLKLAYKPKKLDQRATGPYTIESVHTNGTITIRITPHVVERLSIRRVRPYRR
jgi:hypothetical protein